MLLTELVSRFGITLKSLLNHGLLLTSSISHWLTLHSSLTTQHHSPSQLMLGPLTSLWSMQPEETHVSMLLTHAPTSQLQHQMLPSAIPLVPLSTTRRLLLSTSMFKTSAPSLVMVTASLLPWSSTNQATVWFGTLKPQLTGQLLTVQFTRPGSLQCGEQETVSSTIFARMTEQFKLLMSPTPPVLSSTKPRLSLTTGKPQWVTL